MLEDHGQRLRSSRLPSPCCEVEGRKGGWYGWEPSSSSNFSIRAFRAYPLVEIRHGSSLSSNSRPPYLSQQYPPPSYTRRPFDRIAIITINRIAIITINRIAIITINRIAISRRPGEAPSRVRGEAPPAGRAQRRGALACHLYYIVWCDVLCCISYIIWLVIVIVIVIVTLYYDTSIWYVTIWYRIKVRKWLQNPARSSSPSWRGPRTRSWVRTRTTAGRQAIRISGCSRIRLGLLGIFEVRISSDSRISNDSLRARAISNAWELAGGSSSCIRRQHLRKHGSFLIRRRRGHPGVVLPLVISNSANH